ncbi:acetyl-CoA-benzylalcohol acetyltransferase [Vigna angularis]|uniref:acetyl-CoA-benzylalcohol acetyltransferase n=1 Tax=Phaseolus angularis TaxID=3914 RepID=UPI00080A6035|nr:acetyl-CoA-benzylalcohol acetyltransferase [Vigna angularis]
MHHQRSKICGDSSNRFNKQNKTMEVHEKGDAPRKSLSELQIVTAMSVPPLKVTEPRRVRKVLVSDEHTNAIHGCYQMVLCYENLKDDGHGWYMAGWMVESLARVLLNHPLLAGRLQRKDGTGFEIVANDSGIRLLEACYPTSLSHFLELNERNQHLKTELVFWKEIDAECPQFSPLCYVQVTNFECGGYSIGISCSLLLADVFVVDNFLGKWAEIHKNMSDQIGEIKTPVFYHPPTKKSESFPLINRSESESKSGVERLVFKIITEDMNSMEEMWRKMAMEAEGKVESELGSEFCSEVMKVESWSMNERMRLNEMREFGVQEVRFNEENKPIHVCCWIDYVRDEHVMTVALPNLKNNSCAVILVSLC